MGQYIAWSWNNSRCAELLLHFSTYLQASSDDCREDRKKSIEKKANMLVMRKGAMFFQQKRGKRKDICGSCFKMKNQAS